MMGCDWRLRTAASTGLLFSSAYSNVDYGMMVSTGDNS
jgi:hypothetical protein